MSASAIPRVKAAIRAVRADTAREVALACLDLTRGDEIQAVLRAGFAAFLEPVLTQ